LFDSEGSGDFLAVRQVSAANFGVANLERKSPVRLKASTGPDSTSGFFLVLGATSVVIGLLDEMLNNAVRLVDMLKSPMLQTMGESVVFFFCNVVMRAIQQFQRSVVTAPMAQVGIDRRMVIQIFAVVDCGLLDLPNGLINFGDRVVFFLIHAARPSSTL
jgi:hypothetical protein